MQEVTAEELAEKLPPPRDVEPPSLRQEIFDELLDHLACAARREQLAGVSTPGEVWQRVRARFGNPAQVAAQLFWDRIKGELMKQNLISAALVLTIMCCVAGFGLAWQMLQSQRQLLVEWKNLSTATADAQTAVAESQAAMAKELQGLREELASAGPSRAAVQSASLTTPASTPSSPLDGVPVTFKCVQGTLDGPPAVGVKIEVRRRAYGNGAEGVEEGLRFEGISDARGLVEIQNVYRGKYMVDATVGGHQIGYIYFDVPGDDSLNNAELIVRPGQPVNTTLVVPTEPMNWQPVQLVFNWPEDLRELEISALFSSGQFWLTQAGQGWKPGGEPESTEKDVAFTDGNYCSMIVQSPRQAGVAANIIAFRNRHSPLGAGEDPKGLSMVVQEWLGNRRIDKQMFFAFPWKVPAVGLSTACQDMQWFDPVDDNDQLNPRDLSQGERSSRLWWPGPSYRPALANLFVPLQNVAPHFAPLLKKIQQEARGLADDEYLNSLQDRDNVAWLATQLGNDQWSYEWSGPFARDVTLTITLQEEPLAKLRSKLEKLRKLDAEIPADAAEKYAAERTLFRQAQSTASKKD